MNVFDFFSTVRKSFKAVRRDMDGLKQSTNDWVQFLYHKSQQNEARLRYLESRLKALERERYVEE